MKSIETLDDFCSEFNHMLNVWRDYPLDEWHNELGKADGSAGAELAVRIIGSVYYAAEVYEASVELCGIVGSVDVPSGTEDELSAFFGAAFGQSTSLEALCRAFGAIAGFFTESPSSPSKAFDDASIEALEAGDKIPVVSRRFAQAFFEERFGNADNSQFVATFVDAMEALDAVIGEFQHAHGELKGFEDCARNLRKLGNFLKTKLVARTEGSEVLIRSLYVRDDKLFVILTDNREIGTPLSVYERLNNATEEQRNNWRLIGGGLGIQWPEIDEDVSLEALLRPGDYPLMAPAPITKKHYE